VCSSDLPPVVELGNEYKLVDGLDGLGVPSLVGAKSLRVEGSWKIEEGAVIRGDVLLVNTGAGQETLAAGVWEDVEVRRGE
jgi:hypothetical protein